MTASLSLYEECLQLYVQNQTNLTSISNITGIMNGTAIITTTDIYHDTNTLHSLITYDNLFLDGTIQSCISLRYHSLSQHYIQQNIYDYYQWLFVFMGALTFFMQAGFAMLCAGSVRKKNLINTVLQNLLDTCGSLICFYTVGYAFAFGNQQGNDIDASDGFRFIGSTNFFANGLSNSDFGFWFYQYGLNAISVTIIAGTIAERCQMRAYLLYTVTYSIIVYPIIVHSIWNRHGFLSMAATPQPLNDIGVIDFAGSGVVHMTGGMVAFLATIILGPRTGRFTNSKGQILTKPKHFPGSSIALATLGVMILWFGWYGFNAGAAVALILYSPNPLFSTFSIGTIAARTAANTSLAAASGACSALLTNMYYQKEIANSVGNSNTQKNSGDDYCFSLPMVMNGALSGLVAITAGCATVELWAAFVIGIISGWIYMVTSELLLYGKIDDVVDGIPVHLCNGMWGMIATGLFSAPSLMLQTYGTDIHVGFFYSLGRNSFDATLLLNQCIAVLFIISYTTFIMYPFFRFVDYMDWFRPTQVQEVVGLDLGYHGGVTEDAQEEVEEDLAAYQQQQLLIQQQLNNSVRAGSSAKKSRTDSMQYSRASTTTASSNSRGKIRRSMNQNNSVRSLEMDLANITDHDNTNRGNNNNEEHENDKEDDNNEKKSFLQNNKNLMSTIESNHEEENDDDDFDLSTPSFG